MLSSQLLELFIQLVGLNKGGTMKKHLFGLGAMLVGAGLMFVLMHGEVSAGDKDRELYDKRIMEKEKENIYAEKTTRKNKTS